MGRLETRPVFTRLLPGAAVWLALTLMLASMPPARGQDVGRSPWRGHLALASRGHPGLALAGYGAALASQTGQRDSTHNPSRSGAGDGLGTQEQGQDALALREQGRDALATAGPSQEPAPLSGEPLPAAVTVERRGRLLVLTYGSKSAGGLMSNANPRDEPPGFVVYQGQWPIASGKFEYG